MNFPRIDGLMAATFTPFTEDGSLNLNIVPAYCRVLKNNKVAGAFVCGTTGEGPSLSIQEKKQVAESWADANKGNDKFKLITMVGGNSIAEARDLSTHAFEIGLNGISFTAPHYFKPASVTELAACCIEVASAAPQLPFYYYHIPSLTGVNFSMVELMKALDGRLSNFAGIKYSEENIVDYIQCLQFKNRQYEILWGKDECLLAALAVGGKSAIGSTYNYAMTLYNKLVAAFEAKDLSKALVYQTQSIQMVSLLYKFGGIAGGKTYMKEIGIDCGAPRLPLSDLGEMKRIAFLEELTTIHFDEIRSR